MKVSLLVAVSCLSIVLGAGCDVPFSGPPPSIKPSPVTQCEQSETLKLAEGVYSFRRGLYATLFVVGEGGVIAFDPLGTEAECLGRAIQAAAPGLLVSHVFYSHGDADHIAGAAKLPLAQGVRVYAHRLAVEDLLRKGPDPAILPVTDDLPVSTAGIDQPVTMTLLSRRIWLYYFGPTKTSGNLTIYLPDAQVAMLVDVIMADTVPGTLLAALSPYGVRRTLDQVDRLPFSKLVVGHGPPASHPDVSAAISFWGAYISAAQTALGKTVISVPPDVALDGAPLLSILPQLPIQKVMDSLRPTYGDRLGFDQWGGNGFHFAYLFLTGESTDPVPLRPLLTGAEAPPERWSWVGGVTGVLSVYSAQIGPQGSLVIDPDPQGRQEPLIVVDTLGEHAAYLSRLIARNTNGRKIGHIIYSHAHNDRIAHAEALVSDLSGVAIYAHENAARDIFDRKNQSIVAPTQIISGGGTDLQVGGRTVSLRWYGPSHTDGNLIVHVPEARVAMGVDLVQKGAAPGLMAVAMEPAGLNRTLSAMADLGAQIYLTGQGGYMRREEFLEAAAATRKLLMVSAATMRAVAGEPLALDRPVAMALRGLVNNVADQVLSSFQVSYPSLGLFMPGAGTFGELGVTYCNSESPTMAECQVP